jgi:glycosyltransferase involved in cell wall biosynthesis
MSLKYSIVHLYGTDPQGENIGQFKHRVLNPIELFADHPDFYVFGLSIFEPDFEEIALNCDLLIIHELIYPELEPLILLRRAKQKPTLYEIADDFLALGFWLPENHGLFSPINQATRLNLAALADGIIFSSRGLEQKFAALNPIRAVVSNFVESPNTAKKKAKEFVFGWAGTSTHTQDLMSVAAEITVFCQMHPEVKFAVMGDRLSLEPLFKDIAKHQLIFQDFASYQTYLGFLQGLDVGLAPLLPTAFNQSRTDVKLVEYTICGVACLVSLHQVYSEHLGHSKVFADNTEFLALLELLYANPQIRTEMVTRATAWVEDHRSASAIREQHQNLYQQMLGSTIHSEVVKPLLQSESRQQMLDAWQARAKADHEKTLELAMGLLKQYPRWHQARYLTILSLRDLGQYTQLLLLSKTQIDSIYASLIAEISYVIAKKVQPDLIPVFFSRLTTMTQLKLSAPSPMCQYEITLQYRPYDYFALQGMIHWLEPTNPQLVTLRQHLALFEIP